MNTNFWDFAITATIVGGIWVTIGLMNAIRKEIVEEKSK